MPDEPEIGLAPSEGAVAGHVEGAARLRIEHAGDRANDVVLVDQLELLVDTIHDRHEAGFLPPARVLFDRGRATQSSLSVPQQRRPSPWPFRNIAANHGNPGVWSNGRSSATYVEVWC
jgi:hypothetical protein